MTSEESEERDLIAAMNAHLHALYEVVVDDVVLQTWGNGQPALTHRLLLDAILGAGGDALRGDVREAATVVASAGVTCPDVLDPRGLALRGQG